MFLNTTVFLILLLNFLQSNSRPVSNQELLKSTLVEFGLLKQSDINDQRKTHMALIQYQRKFGLPFTRILDAATISRIRQSRCGSPKILNIEANQTDEKHWNRTQLTFTIIQMPSTLENNDLFRDIKRAFSLWSLHIPISFSFIDSDDANILISFEDMEHGSETHLNFDGTGAVAAHAGLNDNDSAYIHMDNDENWTVDNSNGTVVLQVMVHEIGHVLGLTHTKLNDPNIVMYPMMRGYTDYFDLSDEDVKRIQKLYGKS